MNQYYIILIFFNADLPTKRHEEILKFKNCLD
jgi:hypothetical protein